MKSLWAVGLWRGLYLDPDGFPNQWIDRNEKHDRHLEKSWELEQNSFLGLGSGGAPKRVKTVQQKFIQQLKTISHKATGTLPLVRPAAKLVWVSPLLTTNYEFFSTCLSGKNSGNDDVANGKTPNEQVQLRISYVINILLIINYCVYINDMAHQMHEPIILFKSRWIQTVHVLASWTTPRRACPWICECKSSRLAHENLLAIRSGVTKLVIAASLGCVASSLLQQTSPILSRRGCTGIFPLSLQKNVFQ